MSKPTLDLEGQRINRAAAMMAVSNYGHGVDVERVLNWKPVQRFGNTPRSEVEDLAGHLMESYEHEDMFAEEAEGWAKDIKAAGGLAEFAKLFPHHAEVLGKLQEIG